MLVTAAVLAKVAAPETVTVLANVPADATESACRPVLPPPVGTVRPPAEIVRPPLEMATPPADCSSLPQDLAQCSRPKCPDWLPLSSSHICCMVTCQVRIATDSQAA